MKNFLAKLLGAIAALTAPRLMGDKSGTPITKGTVGATATVVVLDELTKDKNKEE